MSRLLNKLSPVFKKRLNRNSEQYVFLNSMSQVLDKSNEDLILLNLQYYITTASGIWLDMWGSWFGVNRKHKETDDDYRLRILNVNNPKNTIPALKKHTADFLNSKGHQYTPNDISIFEPHTQVKVFSHQGQFSVDGHFPDSVYWRFNTVDIDLPESVDEQLKNYIETVKAGGTKVYYTLRYNDGLIYQPNYEGKIYTLFEYDIPLYMIPDIQGMLYSIVTPVSTRYRSGKQVLWGMENLIEYDHVCKREFNIFSPLITEEDVVRNTPENLPAEHLDIYSISPGFIHSNLTRLRPHIFSDYNGGLSEGFPLSGIKGDHYIENKKHLERVVDTMCENDSKSLTYIGDERFTFLDINEGKYSNIFSVDTKNKMRSGKQHVYGYIQEFDTQLISQPDTPILSSSVISTVKNRPFMFSDIYSRRSEGYAFSGSVGEKYCEDKDFLIKVVNTLVPYEDTISINNDSIIEYNSICLNTESIQIETYQEIDRDFTIDSIKPFNIFSNILTV